MKFPKPCSSLILRLLAMTFMVCDHLWATVIPGNDWLTWVGRLAFPMFAFLIAEGYHQTRDFRRYLRRMIGWALVTELPFNLMYGGSWIYPFQQNVLWTFVISLLCMRGLDRLREKHSPWLAWPLGAALVFVCYLAGLLLMVDYSGQGVLMVLVFWLLRRDRWWVRLGQLGCMYYINWEMMRGLMVPVTLLGLGLEIPRQGAAVLALPLIWMYSGRQGPYSPWLRRLFYGFYPLHMLILGLLARGM